MRVVAVVDLGEQQLQRVVKVGAVAGFVRDRRLKNLIAQTVQAIASNIFRGTSGQDCKLRGGFREQQKQDAVEVAQGLVGKLVAVDSVIGQVLLAAAGKHIIADQLNGGAHRVAQITRDLHGVLLGFLAGLHPPGGAVRGALKVFSRQDNGDAFKLTGLLCIVALNRKLQVNGKVAPERPGFALCNKHPGTREHHNERWRFLGEEEISHQFGHLGRLRVFALSAHAACNGQGGQIRFRHFPGRVWLGADHNDGAGVAVPAVVVELLACAGVVLERRRAVAKGSAHKGIGSGCIRCVCPGGECCLQSIPVLLQALDGR